MHVVEKNNEKKQNATYCRSDDLHLLILNFGLLKTLTRILL